MPGNNITSLGPQPTSWKMQNSQPVTTRVMSILVWQKQPWPLISADHSPLVKTSFGLAAANSQLFKSVVAKGNRLRKQEHLSIHVTANASKIPFSNQWC